jgi:hypothetical protein
MLVRFEYSRFEHDAKAAYPLLTERKTKNTVIDIEVE